MSSFACTTPAAAACCEILVISSVNLRIASGGLLHGHELCFDCGDLGASEARFLGDGRGSDEQRETKTADPIDSQ
jgi:hypothetical protein